MFCIKLWIIVIQEISSVCSVKKNIPQFCFLFADKKVAGKSKDEQIAEKKQELEKRLLDVNDKIGNSKKAPKKG